MNLHSAATSELSNFKSQRLPPNTLFEVSGLHNRTENCLNSQLKCENATQLHKLSNQPLLCDLSEDYHSELTDYVNCPSVVNSVSSFTQGITSLH